MTAQAAFAIPTLDSEGVERVLPQRIHTFLAARPRGRCRRAPDAVDFYSLHAAVHSAHLGCAAPEDLSFRERITEAGHEFARQHLDTESAYQGLREALRVAPATCVPR